MKPQLGDGNLRALTEAFWRFDPAGVVEDRIHTPSEYSELITIVAAMLTAGRTDVEIVLWLERHLSSDWGLPLLRRETEAAVQDFRTSWLS
jgi:hypothetical protein